MFLYAGKRDQPYKKSVDGIEYYNANSERLILINTLSRLSRILYVEFTFRIDRIVKREGIDVVVFASPFYTGIKSKFIFPVWDLGHRTTNYPEAVKWYKRHGRDFMYKKMISREA